MAQRLDIMNTVRRTRPTMLRLTYQRGGSRSPCCRVHLITETAVSTFAVHVITETTVGAVQREGLSTEAHDMPRFRQESTCAAVEEPTRSGRTAHAKRSGRRAHA
jgi:hypothetical protein